MDSLLGGEVYHWHHKMMLKHARSDDGEPGGSFRWHQVSETPAAVSLQLIRLIGAEGLDRRPPVGACRLFLGTGFRLGACWNRLVETVKTRKKREKTEQKWARYGLKRVKDGS